jgi:hypothetical protein
MQNADAFGFFYAQGRPLAFICANSFNEQGALRSLCRSNGHYTFNAASKFLNAPAFLSAAPGRITQSCPLKIVSGFPNRNLKRDS